MYMCMYMYMYMYTYTYTYKHTSTCVPVMLTIFFTDLRRLVFCGSPCRLEDGGSLTMTGTMEYAAPEVLQGESPSEQQETGTGHLGTT